MEKNINISVSGIAFTFEYDAYERLKDYLSLLSDAYSKEEASVEIIADIEARISELILSWQSVSDETVTLECIDKIIEQMGPPDVEPSTNSNNDEFKSYDNKNTADSHTTRRLYRNSNGAKFGGVINGIATYFGKDVTLFRILFIIAFILFSITSSGVGIPITIGTYIVLWCIIPMAKNARQKMEMSGRPITVESLRKNIEEEFDNINHSSIGTEAGTVFSHILLVLAKIIRFIVVAVSIVIGIALALSLVATIGFTVYSFVNYQAIIPLYTTTNSIFIISTLSITAITPLLLLLYVIANLTLSLKYNHAVIYSLLTLLIISCGVASYIIVDYQLNLRNRHSSTISNTHKLSSNKLVLNPINRYCYGYNDFDFKDGVIRECKIVRLMKDTTLQDSTIVVNYHITTKGSSTSEAIEAHDTSDIYYTIDKSNFSFDEYLLFKAKDGDKHNSKSIRITIKYPESMQIDNDYSQYIWY